MWQRRSGSCLGQTKVSSSVLLQVYESPVCNEKAPVFSSPIKEPVPVSTKILRALIMFEVRLPIKLALVAVLILPARVMENEYRKDDRLMSWLRGSFPICPDLW